MSKILIPSFPLAPPSDENYENLEIKASDHKAD